MATPICADLWNPALVHALACDGDTLLAAPVSSAREAVGAGFDNPSAWDINLRFYALTYGVAIVMANRVGSEGLIIGESDYESVRQARFLLPTVRDARALRQRAAKHALAQD